MMADGTKSCDAEVPDKKKKARSQKKEIKKRSSKTGSKSDPADVGQKGKGP